MKRGYGSLKTLIVLTLLLAVPAIPFTRHQMHEKSQTDVTDCRPTLPVEAQTFYGETKKLGEGTVRPWVKLEKSGQPAAVGLTFTEAALTGLPNGVPLMEYELNLPAQAAATPFKHIVVDWNPNGHPPEHIYDQRHFDFHFYTITPAERNAITLEGDDLAKARRKPADEFVPVDYFYVPDGEVPRMGAHWVDQNAHELHGHTFTTTFLYGSYDGHFIFIEPMITKAFLETKPCFAEAIKLPAKYAQPGYYPTGYSIKFDAQKREYTIALEGLTKR